MMNVIRGQVSENLRRVLDAPPPSATQTTSASSANSLQQQPQPRPPLIPASSGLPSHQAGNLDVNTASGGDHKAKFGAKEFVRFDEDEFFPEDDSASCNNVTRAACGGAAPSCRAG